MKLAHLGRQVLMGAMAVALVAGMSVKSLQMKVCLIKSKSVARCWPVAGRNLSAVQFSGDDGKLTGFEVEFAQQLAKTSWR